MHFWARQSSLESSALEDQGYRHLPKAVLCFVFLLACLCFVSLVVVVLCLPAFHLCLEGPLLAEMLSSWSTRGPINTERKTLFFQDCCFRTIFSHRCESSAMTCSSCVPLFKEMHNSHVSHMAATKVFRTEILEPLFAESDDGKVSADDLLNMDKTAMHRWPFAKFVAVMFFLSSSVRTLVGFQGGYHHLPPGTTTVPRSWTLATMSVSSRSCGVAVVSSWASV